MAAPLDAGKPAVELVYEDDALLVAIKPAGVVVHPAHRQSGDTFWDMLVPLFAGRGLSERPRLLHRLDRDTSGLLCVPKQPDAHRRLERALRRDHFAKEYLALVHGTVQADRIIDAPLGRDALDRRRVVIRPDGKPARTRLAVLRRLSDWTLLHLCLETGRTHQIRVHLASIGHPIAGDVVYGHPAGDGAPRLFLHAHRLSFPHPHGQGMVRCHSPLPPELRAMLVDLHYRSGRAKDPGPDSARMIK